jgi:hypothetical protein
MGAMTSPGSNSESSRLIMQEKAELWINAVRNGHLHHRNVWFSLKVQFWPRIGYGLCSSTATLQELEKALHQQYYQILPLGGIVHTTTVESRTIDAGFYGVGLPNLGIEALVAMANKLLMHYGCNTATGKFMQALYSLLFVKVGLLLQPLQESYECYGYLAAHSWIKMLWEKLSAFKVTKGVADANQRYPQENAQFIMQVLIKLGYSGDTLKRLNRMRVSPQLLFMSDIQTMTGSKIDIEASTQRS